MRYKLTIEYSGSTYAGFQKQFGITKKSIEEVLEEAIFKLSQEKTKIFASGRTDAGVHALGQIIHFDLKKEFSEWQMVMGLNNYLNQEDIVVIAGEIVDENFHARFKAKERHYRYIIINRLAPLTLQKNRALHISKKLDISEMQKAVKYLVGEHDFSSFRDAECQSSSPIKTINKIEINKNNDEIFIDISAKSFLHHMVRNIVGTLVLVGRDKIKAEKMQEILEAKDRTKSGPNAPSCGLYLMRIDY